MSVEATPLLPPQACCYSNAEHAWLIFSEPRAQFVAHQVDDVATVLQQVQQAVEQGLGWAVGWLSYEAASAFDAPLVTHSPDHFPLVHFTLYATVQHVAHAQDLPAQAELLTPLDWCANVSETEYQQHLADIRTRIGAGEVYQVNYTLRQRARLNTAHAQTTPEAAWALFCQMTHAQQPPEQPYYGAYLRTTDWTICSASPELFFSKEGTRLTSRPMKGTRARAPIAQQDQQVAHALQQSEKDRAENVMIVDMVRNDLTRIAQEVRVPQLFTLERYPTVWQMTSTVTATVAPQISLLELLRALFPAASITGAPKCQAMRVIQQLEQAPRRLYTGALGFIAPNLDMQFNVAIRTVLIEHATQHAEYGVGSGIVWDSALRDEYAECQHKTTVLTHQRPAFQLLESICWQPAPTLREQIPLWPLHWQRLAQSLDYFGWPMVEASLEQRLLAALQQHTKTFTNVPHKIRLLLHQQGNITLEAQPLQALAAPYRVALARTPIDATNVFLYHKTTQRAVYQHAMLQRPQNAHDVLLWNAAGEITESCIANLCYQYQGVWYTPPLVCGLLPGVQRQHLLTQGILQERILLKEELQQCRLQLMNAVRGRWDIFLEGADA